MQEVKRAGAGAAAKTPWLSKALQEGTFQLVYDGLQHSVQVRMSHALFNALYRRCPNIAHPDDVTLRWSLLLKSCFVPNIS